MADECKYCKHRGNIEEGENVYCPIHNTWYVKTLKEREKAAVELLREYQSKLKADNSKN